VKGRKREGGIRFGEMERDCLLAHGSAGVLQDRLFNCSDKTQEKICMRCGSILSISKRFNETVCLLCDKSDSIISICIPYVLKYLVAELASVNIRVKFDVTQARITNYSIEK
jgi:DNA-directed RNA polymerase I subunit RPA2